MRLREEGREGGDVDDGLTYLKDEKNKGTEKNISSNGEVGKKGGRGRKGGRKMKYYP